MSGRGDGVLGVGRMGGGVGGAVVKREAVASLSPVKT